jgi:hypothetical protein
MTLRAQQSINHLSACPIFDTLGALRRKTIESTIGSNVLTMLKDAG